MIERIAPTDLDSLRASPKLASASITGLGYQGITFNLDNGARANNPFGKDKRVRAALDLAIDRNVLNEVANNGAFKVGNQTQPPGTFYYNQHLPVPGRDVERAKALLKEAGATNPTLTLLVPNADADRQAAEIIQSMAKEVGIEVKIELTEFITMLQQAKDGKFETGDNKFTFAGGTGKFKGVKGEGGCKGKGSADGSSSTWTCEGTYTAAK